MSELAVYLIQECYGVILCVITIICFLLASKKYDRKIVITFYVLCFLVLLETFGGTIERFIGIGGQKYEEYYQVRHFLSWLCYVTGPAILLTIAETLLRNYDKKIKLIIAIPQIVNICVVSTTFFNDWCFGISSDNHWHPGPVAFVAQFMPIVYLIILFIVAILNKRESKWEFLIVFISGGFIVLNYINERIELFPVNLRELTIAITVLAYFLYFTSMYHFDEVDEISLAYAENEKRTAQELVDQCIETLAYTIDAKDKYTKGHSARVAKYSRMIAGLLGKSEEKKRQVYLAGLLHDIGKISIPDTIINKAGKLTDEEYEQIKKHPVNGAEILEKMKSIPYIKDGAKYHHERYDGKGYPSGLKGQEIPELARIIAVADAYDAMTSNRSYRNVMDQAMVRQEIWKGMGTQFDPMFAKIMISLIDADYKFEMREKRGEEAEILIEDNVEEVVWPSDKPKEIGAENLTLQNTDFVTMGAFIVSEERWGEPSKGISVKHEPTITTFVGTTREDGNYVWCAPAAVLFTSTDGTVLGPEYEELGIVMSAGYSWRSGSAISEDSVLTKNAAFTSWEDWTRKNHEGHEFTIETSWEEAVIDVRISNEMMTFDAKFNMPFDYDKPVYVALTGEQCDISNISVSDL